MIFFSVYYKLVNSALPFLFSFFIGKNVVSRLTFSWRDYYIQVHDRTHDWLTGWNLSGEEEGPQVKIHKGSPVIAGKVNRDKY